MNRSRGLSEVGQGKVLSQSGLQIWSVEQRDITTHKPKWLAESTLTYEIEYIQENLQKWMLDALI